MNEAEALAEIAQVIESHLMEIQGLLCEKRRADELNQLLRYTRIKSQAIEVAFLELFTTVPICAALHDRADLLWMSGLDAVIRATRAAV